MKKYNESHEWIEIKENIATVGITDYAQEQLGDIVFVELPKIDSEVKSGDNLAVVESVKAASDIYAPITGKIIEVNQTLEENPELLNSDPESTAWIVKIEITDKTEIDKLLNLDDYQKLIS